MTGYLPVSPGPFAHLLVTGEECRAGCHYFPVHEDKKRLTEYTGSATQTLTFRTSLIARPITNEIAAIPKLIASISRKRDLKGRSFATAI
jgi:hypothetical protein